MTKPLFNPEEMVLLYNPAKEHRCDLPKLKVGSANGIMDRTIMECDQCAQRWWAHVNPANFMDNAWHKLRWYHWVLRGKIG